MKKTFIAACVAAILGIAGYNLYTTYAQSQLSNIALSNLEALADGEEDSPCSGSYCEFIYSDGSSCYVCCTKNQSPMCGPKGCTCI